MLVLSLTDLKIQYEFYGLNAFQLGIHFMDFGEHLRNQFEHAQLLNE
jgi:hypothetical protein